MWKWHVGAYVPLAELINPPAPKTPRTCNCQLQDIHLLKWKKYHILDVHVWYRFRFRIIHYNNTIKKIIVVCYYTGKTTLFTNHAFILIFFNINIVCLWHGFSFYLEANFCLYSPRLKWQAFICDWPFISNFLMTSDYMCLYLKKTPSCLLICFHLLCPFAVVTNSTPPALVWH